LPRLSKVTVTVCRQTDPSAYVISHEAVVVAWGNETVLGSQFAEIACPSLPSSDPSCSFPSTRSSIHWAISVRSAVAGAAGSVRAGAANGLPLSAGAGAVAFTDDGATPTRPLDLEEPHAVPAARRTMADATAAIADTERRAHGVPAESTLEGAEIISSPPEHDETAS
jgi:hypothetical protein